MGWTYCALADTRQEKKPSLACAASSLDARTKCCCRVDHQNAKTVRLASCAAKNTNFAVTVTAPLLRNAEPKRTKHSLHTTLCTCMKDQPGSAKLAAKQHSREKRRSAILQWTLTSVEIQITNYPASQRINHLSAIKSAIVRQLHFPQSQRKEGNPSPKFTLIKPDL